MGLGGDKDIVSAHGSIKSDLNSSQFKACRSDLASSGRADHLVNRPASYWSPLDGAP